MMRHGKGKVYTPWRILCKQGQADVDQGLAYIYQVIPAQPAVPSDEKHWP